jgi:peptidyl-prolyl cis-trans isomerase A (cyclophilin A)
MVPRQLQTEMMPMSRKRLLTITLATLLLGLAPATHADTTAKAALTNPSLATATAPAVFKVKVTTTKGDFIIEAHRDWAPNGVDRFYNLVKMGYYDDVAFFRVIKGFMVQFGINGDPAANRVWREAHIKDDPTGKQSNGRGMVTFAMAGPNTRTSQLFINYADNRNLDAMGFAPIGKVVGEGMKVVDAIEGMYGEGAPQGAGPAQGRVQSEGNAYLKAQFPKLDYIKKAVVVQ